MNREIKFRAWIKEQNRMIKVFGFNEHLVFEQTYDSPCIKENIFEIEESILMQYTGLKDKNGKEIYEGDVVYYNGKPFNVYALKVTGVIKWYKSAWVLEYKANYTTSDGRVVFSQYHLGCEDFFSKKSEVIGNIYENPELLCE